jgi:AcrR family transcriptional regulator
LQTASELFYQQGIKATGIDTIVKASGIAKMSLYKYFPSKDALVLAHLKSSAESLWKKILTGIDDKDYTPQQKLLAVFTFFDAFVTSPDFRGCPFINASIEYADAASPIHQTAAEFYQELSNQLTDWAGQAGCSEPEELATQLSILLAGAITREQIHNGSGAMRNAYKAAKILLNINLDENSQDLAGKIPLNIIEINKF